MQRGPEGSPRAGDDQDLKGQSPPRSPIRHSHRMSLESKEPRAAGDAEAQGSAPARDPLVAWWGRSSGNHACKGSTGGQARLRHREQSLRGLLQAGSGCVVQAPKLAGRSPSLRHQLSEHWFL